MARTIKNTGKYGWNDHLWIACKHSDKVKLKKTHILWQKQHQVVISFNAFVSAVIFPTALKKFIKDENIKRLKNPPPKVMVIDTNIRKDRLVKYKSALVNLQSRYDKLLAFAYGCVADLKDGKSPAKSAEQGKLREEELRQILRS